MSVHSNFDPEKMVRENITWMLALAARLLKSRELAEDAVQEALISAVKNINQFEQRASLKTWLHRITVNASLGKLRQEKARLEQPMDDFLPEFDQYDCRIEPPWTYLTPLEGVLENEGLRDRVKQAINKLPDSYRIVLLLRDIEGYDTAEVATQLELTESNVKVRLHRARAALKKILDPVLRGEEA